MLQKCSSDDNIAQDNSIIYFEYQIENHNIYTQFSMTSLKKNFSMSKLYQDLEKYESNLNTFKDSRVKNTNHIGSSLNKYNSRPGYTSTHTSGHTKAKLHKYSNHDLEKNRLELKSKYERPARQTFEEGYNKYSFSSNQISSVKVNREALFEHKENQQQNSRFSNIPEFSQEDEAKFLKECSTIYGLKAEERNEDRETIKKLLNEINKRDEIYELVTNRLGKQDPTNSLKSFFKEFDRKKLIIDEFKKMSKLDIDDDAELYEFLKQDDDPEGMQSH